MLKHSVLKVAVMLCLLGGVMFSIAAANNQPRFTTITSFSVTCDSVTFIYDSTATGGNDFAIVTVTNLTTSTQLYQSDEFSAGGDNGMIIFDPQPDGSLIQLTVEVVNIASVSEECALKNGPTITPTGTITPVAPETGGDGRFCFAPGEAPAALYARSGGLEIFRVTGNTGERVITVSSADLAEYPVRPESLLTIAVDNNIAFYKLTSGLYQVNVIDPTTGKIHVCQFGGSPLTR